MNDDAKKTILLRRARFLAAALASVGCGKTNAPLPTDVDAATSVSTPMTCLTAVPPPAEPPPTPCLSVALPPVDAGRPQVCLKPRAPTKDPGSDSG